jgi:hypothetical protein
VPHARRLLQLSATILFFATGAGVSRADDAVVWDLEARSGLAYQDYESGDRTESILARTLELRLGGRLPNGWSGRLDFHHEEDLYLGGSRGGVGLNFFGERGELEISGDLGHNASGGLSTPLLYFDPDSLASQAASSSAYWTRFGRLGAGWRDGLFDLRGVLNYRDVDYEADSEILSDRKELSAEARLGLLLPADLRLAFDAELFCFRHPQRASSDRDELHLESRLGRDLAWGELALRGTWEEHDPAQPDSVAYFERPRGQAGSIGLETLYFGGRGDGQLNLSFEREHWEEVEDGYFRSGAGAQLELMGALRFGEDSFRPRAVLDIYAAGERFVPDESSAAELARGKERRLELGLRFSLHPQGRFPVSLNLLAEELRLESGDEDRYTLLQQQLELGWRPRPTLLLRGEVGLDHYGSRYGSAAEEDPATEDSESELSFSGGLHLEWELGPWRMEARFRRQVYVSFLDLGEDSRDWESGFWIRWHP